jgi:ubiquinol-cytochrome c reductase cytochrome c subunit
VKFLAARRRHPAAALMLLVVALVAVAAVWAGVSASTNTASAAFGSSQTAIDKGSKLYAEGCSSCHGAHAEGTQNAPSLIGVGAAAVDFQVSTGRMPLANLGSQAARGPVTYTTEETHQLAAFVASLGAGPAIPSAVEVNGWTNADRTLGGELFRTNCSQCHNFAGRGGALTNGKWAPTLMKANPTQIWEAMLTGPQSMPVFSNATITPEAKQAIIRHIMELKTDSNPGGLELGRFGPVTEGLWGWVVGIGALLLLSVWIGAKVR